MPVTATLSRKFYEALGDDVANELVDWFNAVDLTCRTELRELNELNYARFEARLGEGVATLRADFDTRLTALQADVDTKLGVLRAELDLKLTELRAGFESKLGSLRADLEKQIGVLERQIGALRSELRQELADTRACLIKWMFVFWVGTVAAGFATRFLWPN